MTRLVLHGPLAAPALPAPRSDAGGVAGLAALAAAGCALGGLLLMAGPAAPAVRVADAVPVSASTVTDTVWDPAPLRPGQPGLGDPATGPVNDTLVPPAVPAWDAPPVDAAGEPDRAAAVIPAPVDPAVESALARLRTALAGDPGMRPGAAALAAVRHALDQVGDPYVWGATGPAAYDCSGLTWQSYLVAGVTLPRVSRDQHADGGEPVEVDDLLPGDLVFFATAAWDPGVVHHVGMYVGGGLMVDAPRPGLTVRVEPVWAQGYVGAVRPVPAREGRPKQPHSSPPTDRTPRPTPSGRPATGSRPTPSPAPAVASSPSAHPTSGTPTPTTPTPTPTTPTPTPTTPTPTGTPTRATTTPTPTPTPTSTPKLTTTSVPTLRPPSPVELVVTGLVGSFGAG